MAKKTMLAFILCIGFCMACLCSCGSSDSGEPVSMDESGETPVTVDDNGWKEAYIEVLQQDQEQISAYTRDDVSGTVALNDLNGDGTPELLYFVRDMDQMFPYMKIWTYADGSRQLSYQTVLADDEYSDLPTDALYDYEVQGGTDYMVFKTKDGSLQMASFTYGAANSIGQINCYQMDQSAELNRTQWFGLVDEFMNSRLDQPDDLRIIYRKDGKEISQDEYGKLLGACTEGMDKVIFCSRMPNDVKEIEPLWTAAQAQNAVGQTYEEIMQRLEE